MIDTNTGITASENCALCGHPQDRPLVSYSSPPAEELSSNTVCSAAERDKVKFTISEIQAHIARVDEDTSRLEVSLQLLQSKRQTLLHAIDERRCVIAPIKRLPIELLSKIFQSEEDLSFEKFKGPLLFTFVCRRWRAVAISTGSLWSAFHFGEIVLSMPSMNIIELWLARSGQHPLSISWLIGWDHENIVSARFNVFNALLSHRSRWQDISLFLRHPQLVQLAAVLGPFPLLRQLKLEASVFELNEPLRTFETAASLKDANIGGYFSPSTCALPWHNLRSYTSSSSTIPECLYALTRLTAVVHCDIFFSSVADIFPLPSSDVPVTCQYMRTLKLISHNIGQNGSSTILDFVTAPSLQTLELINHRISDPPSLDRPVPLRAFLTKSSCNLLRLQLIQLIISDQEILDILRLLPDLVDLDIGDIWKLESRAVHGTVFTVPFLRTLRKLDTEVNLDPPLVPSLQRMNLRGEMGDAETEVLLDVIESRRGGSIEGTGSLNYVKVMMWNYGANPSGVQERLDSWRGKGLDFVIESKRDNESMIL